jgi:TPR repeat protein
MPAQTRPFQQLRHCFHELLLPICRTSPDYSGLDAAQLDTLLILADRVLVACNKDPDQGRVTDLYPRLHASVGAWESKSDLTELGEQLIRLIEFWLKAVLWLADPPRWHALHGSRNFGLARVLRELDLLSQPEIDTTVDDLHRIGDAIRRLLFCAYKDRNLLTHDASQLPFHVSVRLFAAALTGLVVPLYRHRAAITSRLLSVVTAPVRGETEDLSLEDFDRLLRAVASERQGHLDRFVGRDDWLDKILGNLSDLKLHGGCLLLTAPEGTGKSALCAKVSESLALAGTILGPDATLVRRYAPWLPGPLIHFGKQSSQLQEIVPLLLAQANSLLLNRVTIPEPSALSEAPFPDSVEFGKRDTKVNRLESAVQRKAMERHRRSVLVAVDRLIEERGEAILLIDALEEISSDGEQLAFLPREFPPGAAVLLTGRADTKSVRFAKEYFARVKEVSLTGLTRDEIPLLTNIPDFSDSQRKFNDRVFDRTSGLPLGVSLVASDVRQHSGAIEEVTIEDSTDAIHRRQADQWRKAPIAGGRDGLGDILLVLAIFEPVAPLALSLIQSYLACTGIQLQKPRLRDAVQPVAQQLEGLLADRPKLAVNAFAKYVRETYFSAQDLTDALGVVATWLAEADDATIGLQSKFLQYWASDERKSRDYDSASKLLDRLTEQGDGSRLFNIARRMRAAESRRSKVAVRALRAASALGERTASVLLGLLLLNGDGLPADPVEGERLLRRSAEDGDLIAMFSLGNRLLDGRRLTPDRAEGEQWLRKAAETGHVSTMALLGVRLLDGRNLAPDPAEGERWLRKAAETDNALAMSQLGNRLLDGDKLPVDLTEGERWLRKAAETGHSGAMMSLGDRLLSGDKLPADLAEGERWLRKAAEADNPFAMSQLGDRLLDGDKLHADPAEGERWLRKAAEADDAYAMYRLGNRLLDGDKLPADLAEGERWLRKAAEADNPIAMSQLGDRLLDGDNVPADLAEGEQWLRKAAESDDAFAMYQLGNRLLDGDKLPVDLAEGERLLRKAAESDDAFVMRKLGNRLLDGDNLPVDLTEGERWLRKAAEADDVFAMYQLGSRLLDGDQLPVDLAEGERWLRKAAGTDDAFAMRKLGNRLLDGDKLPADLAEGERWLRKAAEADDATAMRILGDHLLNGDKLTSDATEGERWLERARQLGDEDATTILGLHAYKQKQYPAASAHFFQAFRAGISVAGSNLTYMLRRNEVPEPSIFPSVEELLAAPLSENNAFAQINYALCFAVGFQCKQDWQAADRKFADIAGGDDELADVQRWWNNLVKSGDGEGDLVLGWLTRHNLATDPDGLSSAQRFSVARARGWDVPEWMDSPQADYGGHSSSK